MTLGQPFGFRGFEDFGDFLRAGAFLAVLVFFFADAPSEPDFEASRRCRRTASTRFPTPRPSRASWVGVEVEPEIFFSARSDPPDFPLVDSLDPDGLESSVEDASDFPELEVSSFDEPEEEADADSLSSPPREDDPPPTSTAAPIPIRRRV